MAKKYICGFCKVEMEEIKYRYEELKRNGLSCPKCGSVVWLGDLNDALERDVILMKDSVIRESNINELKMKYDELKKIMGIPLYTNNWWETDYVEQVNQKFKELDGIIKDKGIAKSL